MKHRWNWKNLTGTGTCKNCGLRTARKARPSKKPRFKGDKVFVRTYRLADGTVTETMPVCTGGE